MTILTPDMKRVIAEQKLGFVATVNADGTPNLSPKGTTTVWDDDHLVFADIHSPNTVENLRHNPVVEINMVDPFVRKGYRFGGTASVVERGDSTFELLFGHFRGALAPRIRAIVTITVTKALPLTSPAYDDGKTEPELRRAWTTRFRKLQPNERFEE